MTKPFELPEPLARPHALVARPSGGARLACLIVVA